MTLYFDKELFKQHASLHLKKILNESHLVKMDGVIAKKEELKLRNGKIDTFYSVDYELEGESYSAYPIDEKYLTSNKQETLF